jgi:hypothetical protein
MATYNDWKDVLAPVVDNGVPNNSARLWARIHEAQQRLWEFSLFVARREDFSDGYTGATTWPSAAPASTTTALVENLTATKLAILAAWREENNQVEMAQTLLDNAYKLVEQDIVQKAERARRTQSGDVGKLHNELFNGVNIPTARLNTLLTQSTDEATAHQNFIARREEYSASTLPAITFEIKKKLVESYLATSRNETEIAAALKKEAFEFIERDIVAAVENSRRTAPGEAGQLHNELPDGVKIPTTRFTTYLAQASTDATSHQAFVMRREDYAGTAPAITFEIKKKLVESYLATSRNETEVATTLKNQAFELVERDVVAAVESARKTAFQALATATNQNTLGGLTGRIGLETEARYRLLETRIKSYINQAYQAAVDYHNFVARREDYDRAAISFKPLTANTDTFDALIPAEVVRLIVMSYIANDQAAAPSETPTQ